MTPAVWMEAIRYKAQMCWLFLLEWSIFDIRCSSNFAFIYHFELIEHVIYVSVVSFAWLRVCLFNILKIFYTNILMSSASHRGKRYGDVYHSRPSPVLQIVSWNLYHDTQLHNLVLKKTISDEAREKYGNISSDWRDACSLIMKRA